MVKQTFVDSMVCVFQNCIKGPEKEKYLSGASNVLIHGHCGFQDVPPNIQSKVHSICCLLPFKNCCEFKLIAWVYLADQPFLVDYSVHK